MVWLMPLQTGNKRKEPVREREREREKEMREGDRGNETSEAADWRDIRLWCSDMNSSQMIT